MPTFPPTPWPRLLSVTLLLSVAACSSQPTHETIAPDGAGPSVERTASEVAKRRSSYGVEIGARADEPLPVVHLPSDPAADREARDQPARDIWRRMRNGFSLAALKDGARVRYYESWYQSAPGYLRLVTGRARPYLHFILQEIERRGLPSELALLPVVESAYIPFAYSRSHAAGIWQFIPETGRLYGLKQNWWYDGRRDILASTMAALDYLEALNELFEGDWFHTLAAYNAGPGRVLRETDKNRARGKPDDYQHLDLPAETRNYVPKLLAVKSLVQDPKRFDIALWPVPNAPYLKAVDVESQLDLALGARLANMGLSSFHLLNPGFSQWATDPSGPHRVLLPIARAKTFTRRLAALPMEERVTWLRHLIRGGETLTHIARRYRTKVSLLQQANGLSSSRIRAGSYLLIPRSLADGGAYGALASRTPRTHVVRRGESLWSIARSYDVSVNDLVSWNERSTGGVIRAGDELIVRSYDAGAVYTDERRTANTINYLVQRGDSLYAIARRFNVSVDDLRRWNNLGDRSLLHPGQAMSLQIGTTLPES